MANVTRRRILSGLVPLGAAIAVGLRPRLAHAQYYAGQLCGSCSFGSKKDNCAKCGKWMGSSARYRARLCGDHGFGNKKDNCVHCGKWVASSGAPAYIGDCCGFGSKKENCVICGKWAV